MCKTNKKAFYKNILQKHFAKIFCKNKIQNSQTRCEFLGDILFEVFLLLGGALEWGSWGYNAVRARCSETSYMPSNRQPLRSEMPAMPAAL
jgi:hypothetical protein